MVSRLIDLPFTKGLDESTDETVMALPAMTELVNYRLTRAGRLEHRLGVVEQPVSAATINSSGDRPDGNKVQAVHHRFLAAGGHGYTCLSGGTWSCEGSVSRFVPLDSYQGIQQSSESFASPSCVSVNGFLVVAATKTTNVVRISVRVFDEATGANVWAEDLSGDVVRVVKAGNKAIALLQNLTTGDISASVLDLSGPVIGGFAAAVTIQTAAALMGIDACSFDSTTFLLSYGLGANNAVLLAVNALTLAISSSLSVNDGAGNKLTACFGAPGENCYLVWLNTTSRDLRYAVCSAPPLVQIGATTTIANVPGTAFSTDNFHPVVGRRSATSAVVAWTDSYVSAPFQTYRTTFRDVTNTPSLGTQYGPIYGYYLASKPFQSSSAFVETTSQPAIWLANHNPNVGDFDRSYFLMLLGFFSRETNNGACSWDMSAAPSAAVPLANMLSTTMQVSEVIESSASGSLAWQMALPHGFRGLGTASIQRGVQIHRFGDASRSRRARTRAIVPCQGSFAVLGGAPRFYDSDRLIEIGTAHGPVAISATPGGGGGMAASGSYRYVFVLEYFDGRSQRQLSYASNPFTATLGAGDSSVDFEVLVPSLWAFPNNTSTAAVVGTERVRNVVLRAYRTSNNGTVFRYSPATSQVNGALAGPLVNFARVTIQDINSDTAIAANEAVYVQVGNALSNYRAPPCRFGCEHEGRLVTAGGWNPAEYVASKLFFVGEGIQFTESSSFRDVCPEPITGVASLDGSLVLFAERGIYVVNGDGPTDDGVGSFSKPRRLPGRVGCVDWRSVVTTDAGAWFRSADGMYLLPRGLAAPQFVGSPIKGKLRSYPETLGAVTVTRAVAPGVDDCDSEQVVAWLVGDAEEPTAVAIFVLSLATQTWSQVALPAEAGNLQTVIGTWTDLVNGTDVIAFARETLDSTETGSLLVENPGADYDQDISGSFEPLLNGSWRTGKVFPFGFGGRGTIRSLRLVGDCLSATTLTPTVYSDANEAGYTSTTLTFEPGRFAKEIPFRQKDIAWIQIGATDPTTGSGNRGAGLRFNGLALEVEMDPGLIRSPAANRSI